MLEEEFECGIFQGLLPRFSSLLFDAHGRDTCQASKHCQPQQDVSVSHQMRILALVLLVFNHVPTESLVSGHDGRFVMAARSTTRGRRGRTGVDPPITMELVDDSNRQPVTNTAGSAVERVGEWFHSHDDACMLPSHACAPHIKFIGDLPGSTLKGKDAYSAAAQVWHSRCQELFGPAYASRVVRIAQMPASSEVAVRWRAEWRTSSLLWLENLAERIGWEIERFDLDPSKVLIFSYRRLFNLFVNASRTGRLRLPAACIEGRSVLQLDKEGLCVVHRESIDVLSLAANSQLRNRKVSTNAAEFLDIRRPPEMDQYSWAAAVAESVLIDGTGFFDLEQMEDDNEGPAALLIFAVITALVFAVVLNLDTIGS